MMAAHLGGEGVTTAVDPTDEEIAALVDRAAGCTGIVIGSYNGHLHPQQLGLAKHWRLSASLLPLWRCEIPTTCSPCRKMSTH